MVTRRPLAAITGEHIRTTLRGVPRRSFDQDERAGEESRSKDPLAEMPFQECLSEAEQISSAVDAIIFGCEGINIPKATEGELRRLSQSLNVLSRRIEALEEFCNACQRAARADKGPIPRMRDAQIELYEELNRAGDDTVQVERIQARIKALSEKEAEIMAQLRQMKEKIENAKKFQILTKAQVDQVMQGSRENDVVISLPQLS